MNWIGKKFNTKSGEKRHSNILEASNVKVIDFERAGIASLKKAHDLAYINNQIVAIILHRGNLDE